jgi:hypothetical protein
MDIDVDNAEDDAASSSHNPNEAQENDIAATNEQLEQQHQQQQQQQQLIQYPPPEPPKEEDNAIYAIHDDYVKNAPFRCDVEALLDPGIVVPFVEPAYHRVRIVTSTLLAQNSPPSSS